jgi:CO/xanthine dehydrogenase FAD-binding subunit
VSGRVNKILSDAHRSAGDRAEDAVRRMPMAALTDLHGSREYREFVTQYTLAQMLEQLEDDR